MKINVFANFFLSYFIKSFHLFPTNEPPNFFLSSNPFVALGDPACALGLPAVGLFERGTASIICLLLLF
jgi:hypothetical protein